MTVEKTESAASPFFPVRALVVSKLGTKLANLLRAFSRLRATYFACFPFRDIFLLAADRRGGGFLPRVWFRQSESAAHLSPRGTFSGVFPRYG